MKISKLKLVPFRQKYSLDSVFLTDVPPSLLSCHTTDILKGELSDVCFPGHTCCELCAAAQRLTYKLQSITPTVLTAVLKGLDRWLRGEEHSAPFHRTKLSSHHPRGGSQSSVTCFRGTDTLPSSAQLGYCTHVVLTYTQAKLQSA